MATRHWILLSSLSMADTAQRRSQDKLNAPITQKGDGHIHHLTFQGFAVPGGSSCPSGQGFHGLRPVGVVVHGFRIFFRVGQDGAVFTKSP